MTTRKKSKRNLSNGAMNMGISLLGLIPDRPVCLHPFIHYSL